MELRAGSRLGPYEIVAPLGEGGMGQVWKALDTRLNRTVAIKTSKRAFDERFTREAQAIAALNHPHICTLYDVGTSPDVPGYLVMEYIEGKPVSGPMGVQRASETAEQILDALDAAHRKGIVHRDLKPGNILLGKNGAKVLDFGLAKVGSEQNEATRTMLTQEGAILGTPAYMAPEQLEGREADARSDIYAFGLVLHEMLTGKRAVTGVAEVPARFKKALDGCLERDPERRWQTAREVKLALQLSDAIVPVAPVGKTSRAWQIAAVAMGLIAIGVGTWALWPKEASPQTITRFQVELPRDVQFSQYVSLSPDGRKMVFNAVGEQSGIWIRDLDSLEWRHLQGTNGAAGPFWSPDSQWLGFAVGNQLKKIPVAGGPAQVLCTVVGFSPGTGAWNRNGVIVFGGRGRGPLWKVPEGGGDAVELSKVGPGESFHALPVFLPDENHLLYLKTGSEEKAGIYVGALDTKAEDWSSERLIPGSFAAQFADRHLFFMRDSTLMAQPFDPDTRTLQGQAVVVAEGITTTQSIGVFSASPGGVLAYRSGMLQGQNLVTWLDRKGTVTSVSGTPNNDQAIRLSPDGTHAVIRDAPNGAAGDLWVLDFARGLRSRLTFRQAPGSAGVWSRDGSKIYFGGGNLSDTILVKAASGAGDEQELWKATAVVHTPTGVSHDGRYLLFAHSNAPTQADLWVLPLEAGEAGRKPVLLLRTDFVETAGVFSPDGRWIAYSSDESGRGEIYVRPFVVGPQGPALGEGKWQISRDGGQFPRWTSNGKEIVFQGGAGKYAVAVNGSGPAFEAGIPQRLFVVATPAGYDVSADGQSFVTTMPEGNRRAEEAPITVVLNWKAQLGK